MKKTLLSSELKRIVLTVFAVALASLFANANKTVLTTTVVINDSLPSWKKQAERIETDINTYLTAKMYCAVASPTFVLVKDSILQWKKQAQKVQTDLNTYLTAKLFVTPVTVTLPPTTLFNGGGTVNYIPKFTGVTTLSNSVIYQGGVNIGIGNTSPAYKLDVSGNGNFSGGVGIGATPPFAGLHMGYPIYFGASSASYLYNSGSSMFVMGETNLGLNTNGINALYVDNNQNIGINQSLPTARFHVVSSGNTSATYNSKYINSSSKNLLSIADNGVISGDGLNSENPFSIGNNGFISGGGGFTLGNASNNFVLTIAGANYPTLRFLSVYANNISIQQRAGGSGLSFYGGGSANQTFIAPDYFRLGINSGETNIELSSAFQVNSSTQGFLPPRMSTVEKNAISSPANGLIIFDTDLGRPCFYNGSWITL
jgi:hypothetical protein